MEKRKAAKRPKARTVTFTVKDGDFAGWEATARADFPARTLTDLQSGDINRVLGALETILTDHNMPDANDEVATTMADVDPYEGLFVVATGIFDTLAALPNR